MRRSLPVLLASLVLGTVACASDPGSGDAGGGAGGEPSARSSSADGAPPALTGTETHWGYGGDIGPDHWADLSEDFAACESGDAQSPIDLTFGADRGVEDLEVDYDDIDEHVVNNGHSIQVVSDAEDDEDEAHLEVADVDYTLDQFHFHSPSEHTVEGRHAPVEFHFVHVDDDGRTAVLGVLGRRTADGRDNPAWAPFVEAASTPVDVEVAGRIDVAALLPRSLEHWYYEGSLTTPPCSEGVHWMVLDHPVRLGDDQIAALETAYDDNSRPVQPRGDRDLVLAGG